MHDQEALRLVKRTFEYIKSERSAAALEAFAQREIDRKYHFDAGKHPDIDFRLDASAIEEIGNFIREYERAESKSDFIEKQPPMIRFMWAVMWKQGDFKKTERILHGLKMEEQSAHENGDGIVFRQFGRHLRKDSLEPIVDQHVLRAYLAYLNHDKGKEFEEALKKGQLVKGDLDNVNKYVEFVKEQCARSGDPGFMRALDHLLFAVGKRIKEKNMRAKPNLK